MLEWRPAREQSEIAEKPFDVWRSFDGDVSTMFHRTPTGFHVRFAACGDFDIDIGAKRVVCTPALDVPDDFCENIFSNQILPLLWTYEGTPVLHASAVVIGGGATAFLGVSGRGKSTLAAAFAHAGHAFLTDDGLLLRRDGDAFFGQSYLPSIRLNADSERAVLGTRLADSTDDGFVGKARVASGPALPFADARLPLRAIYLLKEPNSDVFTVERLTQSEGLDALLQHSFLLDATDRTRVGAHFEVMAALAESCPMFGLDYPREYGQLNDTLDQIIKHAGIEGIQP